VPSKLTGAFILKKKTVRELKLWKHVCGSRIGRLGDLIMAPSQIAYAIGGEF